MPRDYYTILGVSKNAGQDEIKKAFRKKAHELHPDKGGDAEAFKAVNEAYQALGDEKKRAAYDRFGHAAFQGANAPSTGAGFSGFGFQDFDLRDLGDLGDLGDVLGGMFGFGHGARSRARPGRDLETTVSVSFMEAVKGVVKDLSLRALARCERCSGSGAEPGAKTNVCSACRGSGQVVRAQRTPFGVIQTSASCETCRGAGSIPSERCGVCSGSGVRAETRSLKIEIPAGIGDGETVKLAAQGEAAPLGGGIGDLYVHVRVAAHPKFRRSNNDISSEEYAPLSAFLLGATVSIETVDGPGELRVPAGTAAGTIFKLRGRGIPFLRGRGRGDHLVTLAPDVPRKLTREQKKLIDELQRLGL